MRRVINIHCLIYAIGLWNCKYKTIVLAIKTSYTVAQLKLILEAS